MVRWSTVIGRKWNNPEIFTEISDEELRMRISIENYLVALVEEVGSPAFVFSRAELHRRLLLASQRVLREVKTASRKII